MKVKKGNRNISKIFLGTKPIKLASSSSFPSTPIKTMAIIGDSYSTFEGWIPNGYSTWYSPTSNTDNGVLDVSQTWWYQVSTMKNISILKNISYNGGMVSNNTYDATNVQDASTFIYRAKEHLDSSQTQKPDYIFVFGGLNDYWGSITLGKAKYSDWTDSDLLQFLPAYSYLLNYLKKNNPQATIVCIFSALLSTEWLNSTQEVVNYYNCKSINVSPETINGHPTATGMTTIANSVISIL